MAKRNKPTKKRAKRRKAAQSGVRGGEGTKTAEPPALRTAKALFQKGKCQESLRHFSRAIRENPNDVRTLIDAARAFGSRYEMIKCDALLQKALRLNSRRADVHFLAGESYRMLGAYDAAAVCFQKSCFLSDENPAAQIELAFIHERQHRLDEAMELTNRVLSTEPRSASAAMLKARLLRRNGQGNEAEKIFRHVGCEMRVPPKIAAEALGDLAQLLDEQGQYEEAWNTVLKCKAILLQNDAAASQASEVVSVRFGKFLDILTQDRWDAWTHEEFVPQQRVALLAGFPRSGTTLLEQVLDAHPGLISSEEQDIFPSEIFPRLSTNQSHEDPLDQVLDGLSSEEILSKRTIYLQYMEALLKESIADRVHLDKNPAMILMIPFVRRVFPEMKLLIALRDPRDVMISCFMRYLPLNPVSVNYLTLDRLLNKYSLDMRAWLRFRDLLGGNWLEVRYEDVVRNLRPQAQRALEFLDLPWRESVLDYRNRPDRNVIKSPSYETVARPIYTTAIGRWRSYENQLEPVLPALDQFLERFGYN